MTAAEPDPLKLLVVDDSPELRAVLTQLLSPRYAVLQAAEGREALAIIARERPRLVLLDIEMPGMSGLEVLEAARGLAPGLSVIMLTGELQIDVAKRCLDAGAAAYLTKPFDPDSLRSEVRRLMEPAPKPVDGEESPPWRVQG